MNGGEEYVKRALGSGSLVRQGRWLRRTDPTTASGCYTETVPGAGTGFGFGGLANCSADTQSLLEGTIGFWIKVHQRSPREDCSLVRSIPT